MNLHFPGPLNGPSPGEPRQPGGVRLRLPRRRVVRLRRRHRGEGVGPGHDREGAAGAERCPFQGHGDGDGADGR